MRVGNKEDWDFLFASYEAAFETATEQALILTALGCSSDVEILKEYVGYLAILILMRTKHEKLVY